MNAVRPVSQPAPHARSIGRYVLYDQIGSGGMATVHFGRLRGPAGFARTVAIKRMHPHLAANPQFASVFVSEARLAARIRHPNVVSLLDVIALDSGELLLVMEYVHGETLAALLGSARLRARSLRPGLASAIMLNVLEGLHAAHEAVDEGGQALGLVHGDISPRNVIVDVDGSARVLDFGVAKIGPGVAEGVSRLGTPGYMSPEKLSGDRFDRRADVFSAGAVLWEMLCLRRLFPRADRGQDQQLSVVPPSTFNRAVPPALDAVVLRALDARRDDRFPTARAFAVELERACPPVGSREVSAWVASTRGGELGRRARALERIEIVSMAELVTSAGEAPPALETPARVPQPVPPAEAAPAAAPPEPAVAEAGQAQEDPPTAVESSAIWWAPQQATQAVAPGRDEDDTVCEVRPPMRSSRTLPIATPTWVIEPPASPSLRERLRARRLAPAARSLLAALALLVVVYAAAAFNGQHAAMPVSAAVAQVPAPPRRTPEVPRSCQPMTPAIEPATPVAPAAPRVEAAPAPRAAPAPGGAAAAIVGLNRRALAAYEQLETRRALHLLSEGLRLCQRAGLSRGDLAALTHLNMGIVLAGGFKQHGLAVKQFQRALSIRPGIEPSGRLLSPDITAAFAEAGAGVRL